MRKFKENLVKYMDAGFPILFVESFEEEKIIKTVREVFQDRNFWKWNIRGLWEMEKENKLLDLPLADTLDFFLEDKSNLQRKVLILTGVVNFFEDINVSERLKLLAQQINDGTINDCMIVIISPTVKIPMELEKYVTILNLEFLTPEEIKSVVLEFIRDYELSKPNEDFLEELAVLFKGLTETDIKNILSLAVSSDGEINRSDFSLVLEHKQQLIRKSGILEMVTVKETVEDIGGLENLKIWLQRKANVLKNITKAINFGVDVPKGVLVVGMPGCGKSLSVKATANLLEFPLLRLDMGRLMGKYVGESEANLRRAIELAEASAPCVLWIDEMEKAFAGIGGAGGAAEVTTRLFGNFLTWLQEKNSLAFVVATANNITILPPELLRKGRFDEIFYVDLPNENERRKIFEIHISKRRKQDLENIDLKNLVDKTKGYSGADIEGVIKDSIETAFSDNKSKITTEDIIKAINSTQSLSEVMKESIEKLSKIYKDCKFKSASA